MATATSNQVWISQWHYIWLVMDYSAGGGTFTLNSLRGYYSYTSNTWDATSNFTHSISIPGGGGSFQSRSGPSGSGHGFGFGPEARGGYAWDIIDAPKSYSGSGSGSVTITTSTSTGVSEINGKTFTFTGIDVGSSVTTPTLNDPSISSIGRTTANASFSVSDNGGASIVDNYIDCGTYNFGNVVSTISSTSGTFSGLTPNTTYYVRANASNGTYRGYSGVISFKTTHNNPSIGGRSFSHTAKNSAVNSLYNTQISYSTTYDNASYSSHSLVYGTSTSYDTSATSAGTGGNSKFNLNNLRPNTTYYYKITETDNTGQSSTATGSFTTPTRVKVIQANGTVTPARIKII